MPIEHEEAQYSEPMDLDLDLDFSLGDEQPGAAPAPAPTVEPTVAFQAQTQPIAAVPEPMPSLDMAFDMPATREPEPARLDAPNLTLPESSLSFTQEPIPAPAAKAAPAPVADSGMMEFDLGALSLDLDNKPAAQAPAPAAAAAVSLAEQDTAGSPLSTAGAPLSDDGSDPLATKLALAEEFNAIGDPDGARSLAEEVLAEAKGDLKARAQRFLAEIG
jgi:pilus assembly protein FimV